MKKFEFILYINENIICQRFFSIKNFNKNSINSLELRDTLEDVVNIVRKSLKNKSVDYLWEQFNPYETQTEVQGGNIYEKEDVFDLAIGVDDKIVIKERFTGNVYPQKVRYSVDIRELVPKIINRIQEGLSEKKYTKDYLGQTL
jgi:hypothetical protein